MPIPFSNLTPYTGSLSAGSTLGETDAQLFSTSSIRDVWYGASDDDYIEFSVFDTTEEENQIAWKTYNIPASKSFKDVTLTLDTGWAGVVGSTI